MTEINVRWLISNGNFEVLSFILVIIDDGNLFNDRYYCHHCSRGCLRFVLIDYLPILCFLEYAYVLVFVGIAAFFIHFYWTKIGIAEIWNTTKWSSMRSSFYRTFRRFSSRNDSKYDSEPAIRNNSIYSNSIDDVIIEKPKTNPKITSYVTPLNNVVQKPASITPSNQSVYSDYGTKIGQPLDNTKIYTTPGGNYNRPKDLASMVHKQRF